MEIQNKLKLVLKGNIVYRKADEYAVIGDYDIQN